MIIKGKKVSDTFPGMRFWMWLVWAVVMASIAAQFSTAAISNIPYKLAMVIFAVPLAYLADLALYTFSHNKHLNEDAPRDSVTTARIIARALVYAATVLGLTLGL